MQSARDKNRFDSSNAMGPESILPFLVGAKHRDRSPLSLANSISLLSLGKDIQIMAEREWALRKSGYNVHSLTSSEFLRRKLSSDDAITLFCHTLGPEECLFLAAHLRRYSPENRLILLTRGNSKRLESVLFHAIVRSEDGLDSLCTAINRLASAA